MVEQWNSDDGTAWWNGDDRTVLWNSGTVMVEQCWWNSGTVIVQQCRGTLEQ